MIAAEQWDVITVFYVISGLATIGLAFVPWPRVSVRVTFAASGVAFVIYGFYEASQSTGIEFYSPIIFVLPIVGIISAYKYMKDEYGQGVGTSSTRDRSAVATRNRAAVAQMAASRVPTREPSISNGVRRSPEPRQTKPGILLCANCGFWPWPDETDCDNCGTELPEATIEANKGRYAVGGVAGPRGGRTKWFASVGQPTAHDGLHLRHS